MGYGPVVPDHASAKVELAGDGTIILYAGVADMGQGNGATFAQIVGAILNQKPQTLRLVMPDTDRTLPSGSSSASRTTFTFGHALIQAADLLRQRILQRARFLAQNYLFKEVAESDLVLLPQGVCHLVSGQTFPLATIAQAMDGAERCCTYSYTAPTSPQAVGSSAKLRQWGIPHRIFSFAAHLALVQVDEWTGEVNVCQYLASTDAGRILNPDVYEQQVQGGVAQGLGYALTETFRVEKGVTQTRNFTTYTIPTSRDVPDIVSLPVEQMEALGPYGMKGLGEIVIDPVYAAIANAVADAASVRIGQGPLTPERILEALGEGRATPPRAGQERGS
jgi:CO/xanthine dehydrogenase Mo-binding subunit